jgi:hypothetical protein
MKSVTKKLESEDEYVASEEEHMMVEEEEDEPEAEDEEGDGDEATEIELQPKVHPEAKPVEGPEATTNAKQEEAQRKELDNESGYLFLFL